MYRMYLVAVCWVASKAYSRIMCQGSDWHRAWVDASWKLFCIDRASGKI